MFLAGAFALGTFFSGVVEAQTEDRSYVKPYDASYRSPLDLVSEITKVNIKLEKEVLAQTDQDVAPVLEGSKSLPWPLTQTADISSTMPDFEEAEDPFADEHPEYPPIDDPFEDYNRFMHSVNDGIFEYFIEPVASTYAELIHDEILYIHLYSLGN